MRIHLRRPRYADVVATLALFMTLGGSAAALPANSVDTQSIQNHAVTTPKLADEAVDSTKIAPNAVVGSKVADHSLTLSDLAGASQTGTISFTFAAHGCGYLSLALQGARVGELALFAWSGTGNPPQGVMVGPLKIVSAGKIVASACNLTGHRVTATGVGVRLVALK